MSGRFSTSRIVAVLAALLTMTLLIGAADAKPRKVSNGCTAAQISSAKAAACLDQMTEDVRLGRPYFHALYCNSAGNMLCCAYQDGEILPHSCETIPGMSRPNSGVFNPSLSGGSNERGSAPSTGETAPDFDPSLTIF